MDTTVVLSLQQPPPAVYKYFDNLCALEEGTIVYTGPLNEGVQVLPVLRAWPMLQPDAPMPLASAPVSHPSAPFVRHAPHAPVPQPRTCHLCTLPHLQCALTPRAPCLIPSSWYPMPHAAILSTGAAEAGVREPVWGVRVRRLPRRRAAESEYERVRYGRWTRWRCDLEIAVAPLSGEALRGPLDPTPVAVRGAAVPTRALQHRPHGGAYPTERSHRAHDWVAVAGHYQQSGGPAAPSIADFPHLRIRRVVGAGAHRVAH